VIILNLLSEKEKKSKMKKFWVNTGNKKELMIAAIESGADALLVPENCTEKVKELSRTKTVSVDGDLKLGKEVMIVEIRSKDDERKAIKLSNNKEMKYLIIKCRNWKVIPLENLVANKANPCELIAEVSNSEEAEIALGVLEKGVDGVLLNTNTPAEIKKTRKVFNRMSLGKVELVSAKLTEVKTVRIGDRICVDTCTSMKLGQGMLIGNSIKGFFLIHSESVESPYIATRPFRVNAGAVGCYILTLDNKTMYLSEIRRGDDVLIVNQDGETEVATVLRSKRERRPMILVEAEYKTRKFSVILQNAETIKLVRKDGKPISVVKLRKGDEVLVYVGKEKGRHVGVEVDEIIEEK